VPHEPIPENRASGGTGPRVPWYRIHPRASRQPQGYEGDTWHDEIDWPCQLRRWGTLAFAGMLAFGAERIKRGYEGS
jgi:hypothetical protein